MKILKSLILFSTILILFIGCFPQPTPTPIGWNKLNPKISPPPTNHGAIAYDQTTNTAVLFGGQANDNWSDETWIWNGENWTRQDVSQHPEAREKSAMVYDEARNKVVLFGGASHIKFNDTWEWDGNKWEKMNPSRNPPERCCHAMAFDNTRNKTLLYGGWDSESNTFFNDTWEWDGKDWTEITCCDIPVMAAHTMTNLADQNKILAMLTNESGTWIWNSDSWEKLDISNPPSRADGRLVYDTKLNSAIFFGGNRDGQLMNDTWAFSGESWAELKFPVSPPIRYGHMMFYDTNQQRVIIFGGTGESGRLDDMWELNLPDDLSNLQDISDQK